MKISNITEQNRFGVTLVLNACAFSAEIARDTIAEALADIDNLLTEQGAPDDTEARVELIMDNASAISAMVVNDEIGQDEGVADIAYSFVYALGKTLGVDQVVTLRGLTGSYLKNVLSLNPCLGEIEYTASMHSYMGHASDDDAWTSAPTVH
jgi:hypothetical protein